MNLLIILNDLDIGGSQNYTISLINEFSKLGHNIELRILSNIVYLKHRLNKDINVIVWSRDKKMDFNVLKKIRNEIKMRKYDGIIASYIFYQKIATLFITHLPITIYPVHSTIQKNKKAEILNYLFFRLKQKNEIFLTSIDNQTKYLVKRYKLKDDFFKQIYNGIDTNKFTLPPVDFNRENFLKSKGINPKSHIILMVAAFRSEKRHIDAINAFKILNRKMQNISIVFVGDNNKSMCDNLINYSAKNNISNIHFFLADNAGDVKYYYWSAAFFTLTSNKIETFSISALEAMSCGLPCVLTNIGGAKDFVINKINGYLSIANDIENICEMWVKTLNDKSLTNKAKIRNIVIEKYSLRKSVNEYLKLIKNKEKYN